MRRMAIGMAAAVLASTLASAQLGSDGAGSVVWVPVVAHNPGLKGSQWRSDLGLLNPGTAGANVRLTFHGPGGVVTSTTYVPAGAQAILVDVVGQLPASGQGALEISSDQPLKVTSRTYNQVSGDAACYPDGTQGQEYPALTASDGLSESQAAWLPHLAENAAFRTNIGLVNTGDAAAEVTIGLHDGAGTLLTSYQVSLAPGEWKQQTQPFKNAAGQSAMDRGYARVAVTSGSGVVAFASVVDNTTNDATTIGMPNNAFSQQGDKRIGTGAVNGGRLGWSVAISADGSTAIVGGSGTASDAYNGGAWVFTRSGGVWTQQGSRLVGAGAIGGANQGLSVAVSGDGNTAIVGGPSDNSGTGAVWVFQRTGGVWAQQGPKLVGTGASGGTYLGTSAALSADGNVAIVGGPNGDGGMGAAWVFTRSAGVWAQQGPKLVGSGAIGNASQGSAVALSADGNTALVGGPYDGSSGAVWVFTRSGASWTQQGEKLVGSTGGVGAAYQGTSVALSADGDTALVGGWGDNNSAGAGWVFTRSAGAWTQQGGKLVGSGVVAQAFQGWSVALSADATTALLGGPGDMSWAGATWVFTRSGEEWTQQGEKLVGTGAVERTYGSWQGCSVALSADGTTAVVGGHNDDAGEADFSGVGAVWFFTRQSHDLWVPVVAHNPGLKESQWRSDLGLLNPGTVAANVQLTFHGISYVVTNTTYVPAGTQSILADVVGQLGASGQGTLEVASDHPLKVTSRTYNQVATTQDCYPNGTQGQGYPVLTPTGGLSVGQTALLAGLSENGSYRTNIGLVDTGPAAAEVTVELHDELGAVMTSYTVSLAPGEWKQETQPFRSKAGLTAMDRGYAKVTVTSGSGVVAFASVVDNVTNDPTTVAMQR